MFYFTCHHCQCVTYEIKKLKLFQINFILYVTVVLDLMCYYWPNDWLGRYMTYDMSSGMLNQLQWSVLSSLKSFPKEVTVILLLCIFKYMTVIIAALSDCGERHVGNLRTAETLRLVDSH